MKRFLAEMCPATPGNYAWNLQQGKRLLKSGQRRSNSLTAATASAAAAAEAANPQTGTQGGGFDGGDGCAAAGGWRRHSGDLKWDIH